MESFPLRALRIAARQLGGKAQLSSYLMVSDTDLQRWMRGEEPMPSLVMVRVIEFLAERESVNRAPEISTPARQRRNLV